MKKQKNRKYKGTEANLEYFLEDLDSLLRSYNATIMVTKTGELRFFVHASCKNEHGGYTFSSTWYDEPTTFFGVSPLVPGNHTDPATRPRFNVATGEIEGGVK